MLSDTDDNEDRSSLRNCPAGLKEGLGFEKSEVIWQKNSDVYNPLKTNSSVRLFPSKWANLSKRKVRKHPFSSVFALSFREGNCCWCTKIDSSPPIDSELNPIFAGFYYSLCCWVGFCTTLEQSRESKCCQNVFEVFKWNPFGCFQKWGYPKMDGLSWKTLLKWMIWGYPYFWKHPFSYGSDLGCHWNHTT